MNKVRLHKFKTSKLYSGPHDLSIAFNKDQSHERMWAQKVQQTKQVQEKKQIDKILQNIIKERMFGNFLQKDKRISASGYHNLDTINREQVNPSKWKNSRRLSRVDNSRTNANQSRQLSRNSKTLQPLVQNSKIIELDFQKYKPSIELPVRRLQISNQQNSISMSVNNSPIKRMTTRPQLKQIITSKIPEFTQFFRKLAGNSTAMIYDIRITKESLVARCQGETVPEVLQKLMHFFSFPASIGYRQYCNLVESVINCPLKDVYFFAFRILDKNKTGALTISDLFNSLQLFSDNPYAQGQIYQLLSYMKTLSENVSKTPYKQDIKKPTILEMLCLNHNLRLDEVRQLVKQQNHQLISVGCLRSTCYHNSILALEHDVNYRIKQGQLEETTAANNEINRSKSSRGSSQQGLRLREFIKIFQGRRPKIYCIFAKILAGVSPEQYQ